MQEDSLVSKKINKSSNIFIFTTAFSKSTDLSQKRRTNQTTIPNLQSPISNVTPHSFHPPSFQVKFSIPPNTALFGKVDLPLL